MKLPLISMLVLVAGCGAIPVQMHTETHITHADGTVEHKSSDWHGTLDQLPAQLSKAGGELADATAQMAKELTDVPPPGQVELKDLSPALAKFKGQKGQDFLGSAPAKFEYVRLGQPEFDDFFRTTQEIYALVYETTQVISQMKQLSSKLLDAKVEGGEKLRSYVDNALRADGEADLVVSLRTMDEIAQTLATLVPQLVSKIAKLVQTGQALVASAPTAIANPKVLAHLDLVKRGLGSSVKVLGESGALLGNFAKDLSGFKG